MVIQDTFTDYGSIYYSLDQFGNTYAYLPISPNESLEMLYDHNEYSYTFEVPYYTGGSYMEFSYSVSDGYNLTYAYSSSFIYPSTSFKSSENQILALNLECDSLTGIAQNDETLENDSLTYFKNGSQDDTLTNYSAFNRENVDISTIDPFSEDFLNSEVTTEITENTLDSTLGYIDSDNSSTILLTDAEIIAGVNSSIGNINYEQKNVF